MRVPLAIWMRDMQKKIYSRYDTIGKGVGWVFDVHVYGCIVSLIAN